MLAVRAGKRHLECVYAEDKSNLSLMVTQGIRSH